jgi:hypothetical protein
LTAATAPATVTAGCNALSGAAADGGRTGPYGDIVLDHEQIRSTVDGDRSLYRRTGDEDASGRYLLLATDDRAGDVEFFTERTMAVQRAVERTDFEEASAFPFRGSHTACHSLDAFERIRRPGEVRATVCRGYGRLMPPVRPNSDGPRRWRSGCRSPSTRTPTCRSPRAPSARTGSVHGGTVGGVTDRSRRGVLATGQ